jgi:hypothetical protein
MQLDGELTMCEIDTWYSSAEAKKKYWLETADLHQLPHKSLSMGFASGRPTWLYNPLVLLAAARQKLGEEGYATKAAARDKRLKNAANRQEEARLKRMLPVIAVEVEPVAPVAKRTKKEATPKNYREVNEQITGRWDLTITKPPNVAGELATLKYVSVMGAPLTTGGMFVFTSG